MQIMTINDRNYQVISLLGKGKGGYSYLVTDGTTQYVLKQIHHEPCDYYTFGDKFQSELRDYARLRDVGIPIPELLACDEKQERILKEYICGETVDRLILRDAFRSEYLRQMQELCPVLYAAGINIDYYPTNFVIQEEKLYYIDFECNIYSEEWDFEHWGIRYWSKTPEFCAAFEK